MSKSVVVARILSNDLPPLHGDRQTYLNSRFILQHEILPPDFKRLWILNSIVNKSKQEELETLLTTYDEWFETISFPKTNNSKVLEQQVLNVNRARNIGIWEAFQSGANWVLVLDGCSFLTSESLSSIAPFIRDKTRKEVLYFIPMVRLQHKEPAVSMNTSYSQLFPYISGQQECQLGISRKAFDSQIIQNITTPQNGYVFDEKKLYADANKLDFLIRAHESRFKQYVHCQSSMVGWQIEKSRSVERDLKRMKRCGYVLRLLYHPEDSAPANQSLSGQERSDQRHDSKRNFEKTLKTLASEYQ